MRGFPRPGHTSAKSPWCKGEYTGDDTFNDELQDFVDWIAPSESESYVRKHLVWRYTTLIEQLFPKSTVTIQGSFATNTYLSLSDIDLVIFGNFSSNTSCTLLTIKREFESRDIIEHAKVIGNARVPIITMVDKLSKIQVDVSIGQHAGLMAVLRIMNYTNTYPNLRPLIYFVKVFTSLNRLNVPFHGGFGSCHLMHLCIFVIQKNPSAKNLGELVIKFFELIGSELNSNKAGISVNEAPHYFNKKDRNVVSAKIPDALVVQDSTDRDGYLGLYSSKTSEFRERCKSALSVLKMSTSAGVSELETLFRDVSLIAQRKEEIAAVAAMIRSGETRGEPAPVTKKFEDPKSYAVQAPRFYSIQKWLETYKSKSAKIIAQGPLLPLMGYHGETPPQVDLPKDPLQLYDLNGSECKFYFQSDSIFWSLDDTQILVFYEEINSFLLSPLAGHERQYLQVTFKTKYGFYTFYYVPIIYRNAINRDLGSILGR